LPVFAVTNPHKPSKVRVVYDAAAAANGISLNDNLLPGPDLLKSILGVLWRAREGLIAVSGDIRDMFHRVFVKEEDQDAQRFLWRECESNRPPDTYILRVLSFGAKSSPCSAQYVKNSHAEKFRNLYPRAVESIINRHYVDDMLDSFQSESETMQVVGEVIEIHQKAGFEIRNWISNSPKVMQTLNGERSDQCELSLNLEKEATEKILGLFWKLKTDEYIFKLNFVRVDPSIVNLERVPTKRECLKTIMSIFDPIGFASPVIVHAKILIQEVWRRGVLWDQKIPDDLNNKWKEWMRSLRDLENVSIPRCYSVHLPTASRIELHTFVDASELAFAAVSYFRIESSAGVEVVCVGAKNKVAPKKQLSIPRLELQAAVLGTRLADLITREHSIEIHEHVFWSDSQTVISWIYSDHRLYKQFVANRISEILEITNMANWKWIPGPLNVADIATKKQNNLDLTRNGKWFGGPEFLKQAPTEWPKWDKKDGGCPEELKARVNVTVNVECQYNFPDVSRFSSWTRMHRTVGWIVRLASIIKRQRQKSDILELTSSELASAENFLLRKIQWESYKNEVMNLKKDVPLNSDSNLFKLSPFLDRADGLMKIKGRIYAARLVSESMKTPIILDAKHSSTKLLIQAYHQRFYHINAETVVNEIRQRFWIPGLRVAVRKCINDCQDCRIRRAKPEVPEMSPLPYERLAIGEDPFTCCGLDYFGPIVVTIGRRHEKRFHFPHYMGASIRRFVGENAMEEVLQYLEQQESEATRRVPLRNQPPLNQQNPGPNPTGNPNRGQSNHLFQNRNNRGPQPRPANVRDISLVLGNEDETWEDEAEEESANIHHIVSNGSELLEETNLEDFAGKPSPKISGKLGSLGTEFLLDTGSEISLMSEDIFEKLKDQSEILARHEGPLTMMGPFTNSKKNNSLAQVLVKVSLGDSSFLCVFAVSPLKNQNLAILGDNVLIRHKFNINFEYHTVQWTENSLRHTLPLILEKNEVSATYQSPLHVKEVQDVDTFVLETLDSKMEREIFNRRI
jgi:hypothetical protein